MNNKISSKKIVLIVGIIALIIVAIVITFFQKDTSIKSGNTITISHVLGETVVGLNPEKVVVFDFGVLDTLDLLGENVTGVATSSSFPEHLIKYTDDTYTKVGGLKEPDFEKISEIQPDVIFISGRQTSHYEALSDIAPTISLAVDSKRYLDSFKENMQILGAIFEKEQEIESELLKIDEKINTLVSKIETDNLVTDSLIVMTNDGELKVYGEESRFGIIHQNLGFNAVTGDIEDSTHGQTVSYEFLVEKNPEFIFAIDRTVIAGGETKEMFNNALLENTKAIKNNRVITLDPKVWYLASGGIVSTNIMIDEVMSAIQ